MLGRGARRLFDIGRPLPWGSDNLRDAARALGAADFRDLSPIRQKLKDWANDLYQEARAEVDGLRSGRDM